MHTPLVFIDKKNAGLRLIEAGFGAAFLIFVFFVAPLHEAGYLAIPIVLVPTALILDGLLRYLVLKKGIVIDGENDRLVYPKLYSRKNIKFSEINAVSSSKTLHTGAQLNSATYSYDVNLKGDFGLEVLVFASEKVRDEVLSGIREFRKMK